MPSIFEDTFNDYYHVQIRLRNKLLGGVPKDPKAIEGWLRSKAGIDDGNEVRRATFRTLRELGFDLNEGVSNEELEAALAEVAADKHTVGFKRNAQGIYLEDRLIKAMLRESVNILYPWPTFKWGATRKNPRGYFVERVNVEPLEIPLGRTDPDGIELFVGHPSGPTGKTANLTYYEYCERPVITFDLKVLKDTIKPEWWPAIWVHAQDNGLGAVRSQSYGRFEVEAFDPVDAAHRCAA